MKAFATNLSFIAAAAAVCVSLAVAADQPAKPRPAAPATQPAKSAEESMSDLDKRLDTTNPMIEPSRRPAGDDANVPTGPINLDPAVIGNAPGATSSKLRREGDFIVNRLGRLVRATNGSQMLFVFDSDAKNAPDPPLVLLPCRTLESMEDLVRERGENILFILSGQVTTYHGANYVMPTMMKLALDKSNLQR